MTKALQEKGIFGLEMLGVFCSVKAITSNTLSSTRPRLLSFPKQAPRGHLVVKCPDDGGGGRGDMSLPSNFCFKCVSDSKCSLSKLFWLHHKNLTVLWFVSISRGSLIYFVFSF